MLITLLNWIKLFKQLQPQMISVMTIDNKFTDDAQNIDSEKLNHNFISEIAYEKIQSRLNNNGNIEIEPVERSMKKSCTIASRTCSNCGTSSTSTWRNLGDLIVCNACKCFYRKHGKNRPINMRKDTIQTRHRKTCKLSVPNESMFHLSNELAPQISESDSKIFAEAVSMMLHYLQNL